MKSRFDLIGKTITGIIATTGNDRGPARIWMLQFSDGSHVEFVSPAAKRRLIKATGGHQRLLPIHSTRTKRDADHA